MGRGEMKMMIDEGGAGDFQREGPLLDREQIDSLLAAAGVAGTRDILDAFWRSTDTLFQALRDQLARGDLAEAARTAHALKGSALNVGALRLSGGARAIELSCRGMDGAAALRCLCGAEAHYEETIAAFDAHLGDAA